MGAMDVNYLAVIAAGILNMVVGAMWYGPMLFSKQWMAYNNLTPEDMKNVNPGPLYAQSTLATIVSYFVLAVALNVSAAVTVTDGLMVAFWLWLGFIATVQFTANLFSSKKIGAFFLDTGYQFITIMLAAVLLVLWK